MLRAVTSLAKWKTTEIFRKETEFARQTKFAVQRFRFIKREPIIALTGDLLIFYLNKKQRCGYGESV